MKAIIKRPLFRWFLALVCLVLPASAFAGYSNLFLFGDSLSDTGNNAFVFDTVGASGNPPLPPGTLRTSVPTPSNTFIPTYPYATSVGGRYSNGSMWAESFAAAYGLSAVASDLGGTNYAYGGARVGPLGSLNPFLDFPDNFPLSLTTQVATFLAQHPQAPADALYVVAGGGNDALDIIEKAGQDIASSVDPGPDIQSGAAAYAGYVDAMVGQLEAAGAKSIVVWDTPNAGLAPAIIANNASALGALVSEIMNEALLQALADDVAMGVRVFDDFGFITGVASNPSAYGLVDATNACSALNNITACQSANFQYFFWDGIHPTAAGHQLLANAMIEFVPEPGTLALLGVGLAGLGFARRRKLS